MTKKIDPSMRKTGSAKVRSTKTVDPDALLKTPIERELEEEYGRTLTGRQKRFAELYVQNTMSSTACAREAGFSVRSAKTIAQELLNGKRYPHVVEYIAQLRDDREKLYGVTLTGQLERLYKLSRGAENAGQFSAAINAEKIRSALGGLTVDRREQVNVIDQLTRDQITSRLLDLQAKYPQAFELTREDYVDVTNVKRTRSKALASPARPAAEELGGDED